MRRKIALTLSAIFLFSSVTWAADNDGWTEAPLTGAAQNGAWEEWCNVWETEKNDWEKISLTPGADETQLNFAWYSSESSETPEFRWYKDENESPAGVQTVSSSSAVPGYYSNKVTVENIEPNTTYYYSYTKDGSWTTPVEYTSPASTSDFSFVFFGDPQIGSSNENIATGETSELGQDRAVRNDSFNWNYTLERAMELNPDTALMVSAGDQIQSRDKKTSDSTHSTYTENEIEYTGYLSPEILKSMPVATTIGNHDALSSNYSYHFNNPNTSDLGSTYAGGDYYFQYGNALFIMINTNNTNVSEHASFIKRACASYENAPWKIVTLHQDIYGSGEHSNEPEIVELRYGLAPIFEENGIDVVLTGHDHTYSRSYMMSTAVKDENNFITEDEFDDYIDGNTPEDDKYANYLASIEDAEYIAETDQNIVTNPKGILYLTANSASGSKYYDLVEHQQAYIAARWQEDVPTFSMIDVSSNKFTINTYRTDNMEKIDSEFTIVKDPSIPDENEGFEPEDLGLTPGSTEKDINLAWYSDTEDGSKALVRFKKDGNVVKEAEGAVTEVTGTYENAAAVEAGTPLTGKLSHKVSVEGLDAGTEYTYQISNNGTDWSKEYTYTTADEGSFKFAFVADPQLKEGQQEQGTSGLTLEDSWKKTVSAIDAQGAQFIASAGDQIEGKKINDAYKTNETEYRSFFAPDELRSLPYAAAVGNHDINYGFQTHFNLPNEQEPAMIENFKNNDDEEQKLSESVGNYYYSYNNALFVVLNDSAYPCDSTENYEEGIEVAKKYINEFDKTLEAAVNSDSDYNWLFVQHHKSTTTAAQHTADFDVQAYVEAGFEKLMDKYDVDFVFTGHDHVYTRSYVMKDGRITGDDTSELVDPEGTIYLTGNTASGKEYYDIYSSKARNNENYPALANGLFGGEVFKTGVLPLSVQKAVQDKKPEYSIIDVTDDQVTIKAYYNDSNESFDEISVTKTDNVEGLKITQLSDTHLHSESLGTSGTAFEEYIAQDRKMVAQSQKIFEEAVARVINSDSDYVLVTGDLTKDGEKVNHMLVASKLKEIEDTGKKVFVIPGNHDISNANAYQFNADGTKTPVETITPSEFKEIYADFGYNEAVSQDTNSVSYAVDLDDTHRLIAIDSCIYSGDNEPVSSETAGRIKPETMEWIKEQTIQAQKEGKKVIAMMHHGVVPHMSVQPMLFPEYLVEDYDNVKNTLADLGIPVVFTGHFHSQDISGDKSPNGNIIYDIEAGSLLTNPSPIRHIVLGDDKVKITTEKILSVKDLDLTELNSDNFIDFSETYLKSGLLGLITDMADNMMGEGFADIEITNGLTVKEFLAEAMYAHYRGDENPDPSLLQTAQYLASSTNAQYQYLGTIALGIMTDYSSEGIGATPDNNVTLNIVWNNADEDMTSTTETTTTSSEESSTETTTASSADTSTEATTASSADTSTETTTRSTSSSGGSGGSGHGSSTLYVGGKTVTSTTTETTTLSENTENTTEATTTDSNTDKNQISVQIGSKTAYVNGAEVEIDVAPYIQSSSNSTMVPLRFVTVALLKGSNENADTSDIIKWDPITKTVTITDNGITAAFTAGNEYITVNGIKEAIPNNAKAEIKDNRMFIPFRALGNVLGASVEWDADTRTATFK